MKVGDLLNDHLNFLLSRRPWLYEKTVRLRANVNFEKLVFLKLVRDGDVVLDVGANRGYYTLLFSHLVGPRGQVHAFEPVPPTFEKLSLNVASGKRFDNVYLEPTAVGERSGSAKLYMPGGDDGQSSLTRHSFGSWTSAERVRDFDCEITTLDEYAEAQKLVGAGFIKCDVEGAELLVLRGASQLIRAARPLIYLEVCHGWTVNFDYSPPDVVEYLSALGYTSFYLVTDGLRLLKNPADDLSDGKLSGSANLLCSIPAIHAERMRSLLETYLDS